MPEGRFDWVKMGNEEEGWGFYLVLAGGGQQPIWMDSPIESVVGGFAVGCLSRRKGEEEVSLNGGNAHA
jgi:hypothetical protein